MNALHVLAGSTADSREPVLAQKAFDGERFLRLDKGLALRLCHVPSHVHVPANEAVDKLAKLGASLPPGSYKFAHVGQRTQAVIESRQPQGQPFLPTPIGPVRLRNPAYRRRFTDAGVLHAGFGATAGRFSYSF